MENTAETTFYPPDTVGWHSKVCDTPNDIRQTLDHTASPEYRVRSWWPKLETLSDELSSQCILGRPNAANRIGGGGQEDGVEDNWGGKHNQGQHQGEEYEKEYEVGDYEIGDYYETDNHKEHDYEDEDDHEDEDDSDNDDSDDDSEGEAEEEGEPVDGNCMLWTCSICNTTINIFARDDHLYSRSHIKEARKKLPHKPNASPDKSYLPPMWRCTFCDEEMTIFHQADHEAGIQHRRMVRKQLSEDEARYITPPISTVPDQHQHLADPPDGAPDPDTIWPDTASTPYYEFRNTFYCMICAAELDRSVQELHLDDSGTWDCTLCAQTMHVAAQEQHLHSEGHLAMTGRSQAPAEDVFYCSECQRVIALVLKADHLAGTEHRNMAARNQIPQRYFNTPEGNSAVQWPNPPPETFSHTASNWEIPLNTQIHHLSELWNCTICNQAVQPELFSSHLIWHFNTVTTPITPYRAPPVPERFFCDICNTSVALEGKSGHLNGQTHRKNAAAKAKTPTTFKPAPPEGSLYCDICKKYKKAAGMASHKRSKKHKKKAAAKQQAERSAIQTTHPRPAPPAQAVNPVVACAPYITISGDTFYCEVCSRYRKVEGMESHVKSKKHKKSVAAEQLARPLALRGGIVQDPIQPTARPATAQTPGPSSREGKDYCAACRKYKTPEAMARHVKSKKHKGNAALAGAQKGNPIQ